MEARLYAEDPARGFLPQAGQLLHLIFPAPGPHLRVDSGYRAGDSVPVDYDPMIAKLIVWGKDRHEAALRLTTALEEVRLAGLRTNLELLLAIAAHGPFRAAPADASFVERSLKSLLPGDKAASADVVALAAIGLLCERQAAEGERARQSPDPYSPWNKQAGWRLNGEAREILRLYEIKERREHGVAVTYLRQGFRLALQDTVFPRATATLRPDGALEADLDGHRCKAVWLRNGREVLVLAGPGEPYIFEVIRIAAGEGRHERSTGGLIAPMPGRIAALLVEAGTSVAENQPLLILEAMKMEHLLRAPNDGVVKKFNFGAGDQVAEGAELVTFEVRDP
jgi:3-methylcrotonyl-CoA carboxylase alpha subunit